MDNPIIIGITGHSRSGKTTVAQALSLLDSFSVIGLADGVRSAYGDLDGPTWEYRKEADAYDKAAARRAMQIMGSECRNAIGASNHWVNHVLIKIEYAMKHHCMPRKKFVIPDVRFQHEIDRLGEYASENGLFYETWKVVRPGFGQQSFHDSETGIDSLKPINIELVNDKSKEDLIRKIPTYLFF